MSQPNRCAESLEAMRNKLLGQPRQENGGSMTTVCFQQFILFSKSLRSEGLFLALQDLSLDAFLSSFNFESVEAGEPVFE